jgi:O-antigen/teichoic acid export membrane protein
LAIALLMIGAMTLVQYRSACLRGAGRFAEDALWQVAQRSLTALGVVILLLAVAPAPTFVFLGWLAGAGCVLLIPLGRSARRATGNQKAGGWRFWWAACAPFVLIDLAAALYFRIDLVLLEWLGAERHAIGLYAAASRLLEVLLLLAVPVGAVFFRALRLTSAHPKKFQRLLRQGCGLAFVVALGLWWLSGWLADEIVLWAFGHDFADAAPLLPWIMAVAVFVLPNIVLTQALIARNCERAYAQVALLAAVLNIVLDLALIPHYGLRGAALSALLAQALLMVLMVVELRRWQPTA